jgi:hypothetical protein
VNKQAFDTDCVLQTIYLSEASAKVQHVMHDLGLRRRCELPPPGVERAEKKASRQRTPMHGETDLGKPAKRPFVIGMWQ